MANLNIRTTTRLESLEGAKILAWSEGAFPVGHVLPEDLIVEPESPIPVGMVCMFAGSVAPDKWFLCVGGTLSRTAYSDLFAVIGEIYGVGDGVTTFNLPDFKASFPIGANLSSYPIGEQGGEPSVTLTSGQIPAHGGHCTVLKPQGTGANSPAGSPQSFGGGLSHNNIPPYLSINFIIYAGK